MDWEPPYRWDEIEKCLIWATVDSDGRLAYWEDRPFHTVQGIWQRYGGRYYVTQEKVNLKGHNIDWRFSLRKRPNEEFYF